MKLNVHKETIVRVPSTRLGRLFDIVVRGEAAPKSAGQVNLVFTDDKRLRGLNREFRSRDRATDVLSFNIDEPDSPGAIFGEIYISVPFARRQAEGYGATLSAEIVRLFCHGLLHLFGYDHHSDSDSAVMEKRHLKYLSQVTSVGRIRC